MAPTPTSEAERLVDGMGWFRAASDVYWRSHVPRKRWLFPAEGRFADTMNWVLLPRLMSRQELVLHLTAVIAMTGVLERSANPLVSGYSAENLRCTAGIRRFSSKYEAERARAAERRKLRDYNVERENSRNDRAAR
jgi:hypothetical protein